MVTAILAHGLSATTAAVVGKPDKHFCRVTSLPKETTEEDKEHCNHEASTGEKRVNTMKSNVHDDDFADISDGNWMSSCSNTMSNMKQPLRYWEGARHDNDNNNNNNIKQNNDNFRIDLTDVPQQEPILSKGNKTSKYRGVCFLKPKSWQARITIQGKLYHIGTYDYQEDAARDYARALFKYKCARNNNHSALNQSSATATATATDQSTTGKEHQLPNKKRRSNCVPVVHKPLRKKRRTKCVDLTDVPARPLILNNRKGTTSKYKGVTFCKKRKKWLAYITVKSDGRLYYVGAYNNEQEAAADYARAAYKYNDMYVPPIQKKEPAYDYPNVFFNMVTKKWMASVTMDGRRHLIGCYDSLKEATDKHAEAVLHYKALDAFNRKEEKKALAFNRMEGKSEILSEREVSMCLLQLGSE